MCCTRLAENAGHKNAILAPSDNFVGPHSSWCLILTQGFGRNLCKICKTRNVGQCPTYGRPAEYRWRPLFNAAVWLTPTTRLPCSNTAKTRNPLKLQGCPKLANGSQSLAGRSSPYCVDMWKRYCCLTSFFRLSMQALVAKI